MRRLQLSALAASTFLLAAPSAGAHVLHTVAPGETLWWIAAQNNLTTRTVAVYNGLPSDAKVLLGGTLKIPTVAEGAAALAARGVTAKPTPTPAPARAAPATPAPATHGSAPSDATPVARPVAVSIPPPGAPRPMGAYVVRAGDTLSGLAGQTGVSVAQMAFVNGIDPAAILKIGTVLKLPTGAPAPLRASLPLPAVRVIPTAAPMPTAGVLSADRIKQLAAEQGAPAALAAAIAWQESGFNNARVSPANARGVMQVMPGTWAWVQANLATGLLNPTSAEDNVRAGSLYLARLLRDTNGDLRLAVAAYYQGLYSVRSRGMFDDTKRYVDNVMSLSSRYGG